MLASAGPALQLVLLAMTRTLLVDAKPNPASCNEHEAVKKHEIVCGEGPFIVNEPTRNAKLA
jgi:hypothetical protein